MNANEMRCERSAAKKYYWPGKGLRHVCHKHTAGIEQLASGLGIDLVIERNDDVEATCDQIVKNPEEQYA